MLGEALLATQYLIAECNYGGRIIDKYDRRLLKVFKDSPSKFIADLPSKRIDSVFVLQTLLLHFNNENVASQVCHQFSDSGLYSVPADLAVERVRLFAGLPTTTRPEAFGLNENAEVTKNCRMSERLLQVSFTDDRNCILRDSSLMLYCCVPDSTKDAASNF